MARETTELLSRRDLALLQAVADKRCEIVHGSKLALFMDGRVFPDRDAARRLIQAGLVAQPGLGTGRWPARLTGVGERRLAHARA
jgi:hypothetical protein